MMFLEKVVNPSIDHGVRRIIIAMTWRRLLDSMCQFIQILRWDLLNRGPWSVKFLVGAAAKITTQGADRDLPFRVGATPVVTDRGVLE